MFAFLKTDILGKVNRWVGSAEKEERHAKGRRQNFDLMIVGDFFAKGIVKVTFF